MNSSAFQNARLFRMIPRNTKARLGLLSTAALLTTGVLFAAPFLSPTGAVAEAASFPNPDYTEVLSASKLANKIQSTLPENSHVIPVDRGYVDSIHVAQYNANQNIEDTYKIRPSIYSDDGVLVGMFDGHGGTAASAFCRDELLEYLDIYKHSNLATDVIDPKTLQVADSHFLQTAVNENRLKDAISGACIAITHIKQDLIQTASAGDCRVVVGREVPENTPYMLPSRVPDGPVLATPPTTQHFNYEHSSGFNWFGSNSTNNAGNTYSANNNMPETCGMKGNPFVPVELAVLHQIDLNNWEMMRLLYDHPNEADIIRHSRVKGGLQPTRGFGDGAYKRRDVFEFRYASRQGKLNRVWTAPYTTVVPDISYYKIQKGDKFIVLSTDGLFEDMDADIVTKYMGDYIHDKSIRKEYPNASHFLISKALLHASQRAIGKRKDTHNLSWITSLNAGDRRNVHDDITAMVIFLKDTPTPDLKQSGIPRLPPTMAKVMGKSKL